MAMPWLQPSAFLLLSLLLARPLCAFCARWLAYLCVFRHLLPHGATRDKHHEVQVILCGFPRTGTVSLMKALEILGFPCFHGLHLTKPTTANLFLEAVTSGNPVYWEKLLDGYAAVADFPGTCGYKKLMGIFPDAKIILNIRDPNTWYDSFIRTLGETMHPQKHPIFKIIISMVAKCMKVAIYNNLFHGKLDGRENVIDAYLRHIDEVKEHVPGHKLLVYDIEKDDGWAKLCEFLDVPIPESPFPRSNDRKMYSANLAKQARFFTLVLSLYVACVSCTLFFLIGKLS